MSFTGNTETRIGESSSGFYYNETLINTNLQYGAFTNWIQLEYSDPPELGRSINGVRKLRLEYDNGPIQLKLGDLYEIWGRGLVLNSVDDQSIDRDTSIRGLTLIYNNDSFSSQFIAGKADISQSTINALGFNNRKHNYQVSHNLYGLNIQKLLGKHNLGFSFLQGLEKHPVNTFPSDTIDIKNQFHSLNYSLVSSLFDFYAEYIMSRSYEFDEDRWKSHSNGRGLYSNLNLYFNLFSLNLEYINYRYSSIDPISRFNIVDYYGYSQPYQNPPVAIYIHENILMNRISHQTDYNNEVGYKAELIGSFYENIEFLSIFSQSNRTHSWVMDENYMWKKDQKLPSFPSFNPTAMPFKEFYTELTFRTLQNKMFIKVGYADMKDIIDLLQNTVTDTSQSLTYSITDAQTIPLNFSYSFSNGWSIESKIELQWLSKGYWWYEEKNNQIIADSLMSIFLDDNGKRLDQEKNTFISFTVSKSPKWSLTLTSDNTSVKESFLENKSIVNPLEKFLGIDQERNWVNVEFVYHITSSMRFSLLYGSLKGGLLCTNGVCRIIEPFDDGFKIGLSTVF
ncbi:uncharacterized protein METZ01_LOCUS131768 [marine metagenome]|uniref:TonB-dependent receptor-like beta-barrel domain-containing protein n=1 Tax=marine metagenome TaxID=408172 RepID=A0A381YPP1_9ZZZZ